MQNETNKPIDTMPVFGDLDLENSMGFNTDTVHIRLKQRNGKKKWTFVEGLNGDINLKKDVLDELLTAAKNHTAI